MVRSEVKQAKVYKGLYDEFARIAHIRFINKLDKQPSPPRVQKKAMIHPLWGKIRHDLEIAEFLDDKKGQTTFNIFTFMITAFLVVVFFAGLIYFQGILTDVFHQVGLANEANAGNAMYTNMTLAADQTFGVLNNSIQALKMVALVYILALAVCIIITNTLMKVHPLWFFAYILISALAIVFSVPIANAYHELLSSNIFDGGLMDFVGANFLLDNLPVVVMVISVLGGIFLFINLIRSGGETDLR